MKLTARLRRLEKQRGLAGGACCDARPVVFVVVTAEGLGSAIPGDAPRCLRCGEVHALEISERIVTRDRPDPAYAGGLEVT
jgi:hypothetical protein